MIRRKTVNAVIIAKNEEKRIARCIDALGWVDGVVVIDNNSTDNTVRIAENSGAKVFKNPSGDFSDLRNEALKRITSDWILYVDADETVTDALREEITGILMRDSQIVAYNLPRKNLYLGYPWPYMDEMVRLIRRDSIESWTGVLHEHAVIRGKIGRLENFVIHDTHRTLSEMVQKTNIWSQAEADLRFAAGHPEIVPWRIIRVMITGFGNSYFIQGGWKAGVIGLIESIYQSYSMFITYAKLWELQQKIQNKQPS